MTPKLATNKQIVALLRKDQPLTEFTRDFYHKLAEASPSSITNPRQEHERRFGAIIICFNVSRRVQCRK